MVVLVLVWFWWWWCVDGGGVDSGGGGGGGGGGGLCICLDLFLGLFVLCMNTLIHPLIAWKEEALDDFP